jgi:RNA polymerase sigma-70 factor (ECF subfamily)
MGELDRSADAASSATPVPGDEEAQLARRAQMGSTMAFERLVVTRGPELYRYLVIRLRNESDARDALQETLAAAWQSLPSLRQPARFWPWLVAIAAHKAADVVRARRPATELDEIASWSADETVEVREALDRLPPRFREVLLLRFGLDLTEQEVADVLGVRVGTVKSRSARARRALGELLQ